MAESTLAPLFNDFAQEVGQLLSFGRDSTAWGTLGTADTQYDIISRTIQRGYRRFLSPPPINIDGRQIAHRWSFLHPITTLTTSAPYSTGTITYDHTGSANELEITLASGPWPSCAADGSITINSTTYAVATRTSDSIILLATGDNPGADIASGTSYELGRQDMDLDDDFGAIEGTITYQGQSGKPPIMVIGSNKIRELRNRQSVPIRAPYVAAVRLRDTQTTTTGARWELLFYPTPDAAYVLTFQYIALVPKLDTTNTAPVGGMMHGETIMASIMAMAEAQLEPAPPQYNWRERFKETLEASIRLDMTATSPEFFGYNRDNSDAIHAHHHRFHRHGCNYNVTYAGQLFP